MMKMKILLLFLVVILMLSAVPGVQGQLVPQGKYAITANGGYSMPLTEMKYRFQGTYNIDAGFYYGFTPGILGEFRIVYGKFDKITDSPDNFTVKPTTTTSTTYTIPPGFEMWYRYAGFTPSLVINFIPEGNVTPYLILGTGLYRFDYFWAEGQPYTSVNGAPWSYYEDPVTHLRPVAYPAKHLTQWALGLNGGAGLGFKVGANAVIDIKARWEVLISDLWPVLYLGLREVRPIQFLQLTGGVRFIL